MYRLYAENRLKTETDYLSYHNIKYNDHLESHITYYYILVRTIYYFYMINYNIIINIITSSSITQRLVSCIQLLLFLKRR